MDAPLEPDLARGPYRPAPEAPSKRWARAALGLRIVAWATLGSLVVREAGGVIWQVGWQWRAFRSALDVATMTRAARVASTLGGLALLTDAALVAGLAVFASLPRRTGARNAALVAAGTLVVLRVVQYLGLPAIPAWLRSRGVPVAQMAPVFWVLGLVLAGAFVAYVLALLRALERAQRACGASWPAWVGSFTGCLVAWHVARPVVGNSLVVLAHSGPPVFAWALLVLGVAVNVALTWPLVKLLRGAADVLARQEAPESALR